MVVAPLPWLSYDEPIGCGANCWSTGGVVCGSIRRKISRRARAARIYPRRRFQRHKDRLAHGAGHRTGGLTRSSPRRLSHTLHPGGVFNKGFIRAYAKTLGFNPEEAISEYLTALRQAQLDAQNAAWDPPPQKTASPNLEPSPKVVTPAAKSSNASGTKLFASGESATPVPAIAPLQESGRSPSLQSASLQSSGAALDEFPLPRPLVQPTSEPQAVPPPLWISPPSSSKWTSPPRAPEPPAVLASAFDPPSTVEEVLPAPQVSAQQESGVHEMQSDPQVLVEEAPSAPISVLAAPALPKAAPPAPL